MGCNVVLFRFYLVSIGVYVGLYLGFDLGDYLVSVWHLFWLVFGLFWASLWLLVVFCVLCLVSFVFDVDSIWFLFGLHFWGFIRVRFGFDLGSIRVLCWHCVGVYFGFYLGSSWGST